MKGLGKYFKKILTLELDNSCVEYRVLTSIFNSNKTDSEKLRLYDVYIPGIKNQDEIKALITLTKVLEEKNEQCQKFFEKNKIKDKKKFMDEKTGLSQTLNKLEKTGNKLKVKSIKKGKSTGELFKSSTSSSKSSIA